jgi:hypothetical protein
LNRIVPFSAQIHERPSSICDCVCQRKPAGSRRSGSMPSSSRQEEVEVAERGLAQPGRARLRLLVEDVDGLSRSVVLRPGQPPPSGLPELVDRRLVPDDHPRGVAHDLVGEPAAVGSGGHDVGSEMAEGREAVAVLGDRAEAAEAPAGDVLEEDALDWIHGAEGEHLLEGRFEKALPQHRQSRLLAMFTNVSLYPSEP